MSLWQPTEEREPTPQIELPSHEELVAALRELTPIEITPEEQARIDAFRTPVTWKTMMQELD